MAAKFEIYEDKAGEFRFRLKAGNGENIGASEGYKAKASAKNGVESVRKNSVLPERFTVFEGKSGKWYFNLKAGNHEIIMTSQGYTTEAGAKSGTEAVTRAAPEAEAVIL
ncbi:YegP family protein [Amphritea sp. 2_MG-2023]|uniref:YegP family protein n=1 Tax=Amphritea TaxID=515417 RepID=UPI001C072C60|nr:MULTISPECIES: YegP family protein [Amphritea]MBU2966362.1 YegP family protein [Amphritea atlantica]MDO6419801.1 YegP family protein [Amphritea sp. 2_MG-2023]MDX2424402.1 YegP family protein [Amphritea sp.]